MFIVYLYVCFMLILQPDFGTIKSNNKSVEETLQFWGFVIILVVGYLVISALLNWFKDKK